MSHKIKNKISTLLKSTFILAIFAFAIHAGAVWILPGSGTPPSSNVSQPVNVGDVLQFKNGSFVAQGLKATVAGIFEGSLQIVPNAGLGKVLTSNETGMATWQTPSGGSGNGGGDVTSPPGTGGTVNYVTKWTGPTAIGNSQIFDNGAHVGIATATPDVNTKLDVNGKVKMTGFQLGSTATQGQVLTTDASGNGTWQAGGSNSGGGWTRDPETFTVRLTTATDKVGIGTATPNEQLEITKNLRLPNTTENGTAGVIFFGPDRFISNYGAGNTFVGKNSGNFTMSGDYNTGVGEGVLTANSSGNYNSALGHNALLSNSSGSNNVAVGKDALKSNGSSSNNTAVGYQALENNSGQNNSALGSSALFNNSSGSSNTAIGRDALFTNSTGTNNTAIGYQADVDSGGLSNATAIGNQAKVGSSNTMVFGNGNVVGWGFGTQPGSDDAIKVSNGARLTISGAWTPVSDRTKKHNIQDISYGLNEIMNLRPVSFDWNKTNQHDIGFIAQEVKPIIPELVYGEEGDMTLNYAQMTAVLTKAVQDLKAENDSLRARLDTLKLKMKDLQEK